MTTLERLVLFGIVVWAVLNYPLATIAIGVVVVAACLSQLLKINSAHAPFNRADDEARVREERERRWRQAAMERRPDDVFWRL